MPIFNNTLSTGMPVILIADSGSTKAEWVLLNNGKKKTVITQGISPYFLNTAQIAAVLQVELIKKLGGTVVEQVFFYGTGCANIDNAKLVKKALKQTFPAAGIDVQTDLMAAARALCKKEKGVACILGTGSNSCYYNGKKIVKNSPGIGYVLGDEGSGAYLGKLVVQHFMYNTFDEELQSLFEARFAATKNEILENVYKKPLPNRYLAQFALFLAENRGHYMIENIIYDGLNDFYWQHLCKYGEVWKTQVHFIGSVAYGFRDVLQELCLSYGFELGTVLKTPMPGLITYHTKN